jgi:hypothetical protein
VSIWTHGSSSLPTDVFLVEFCIPAEIQRAPVSGKHLPQSATSSSEGTAPSQQLAILQPPQSGQGTYCRVTASMCGGGQTIDPGRPEVSQVGQIIFPPL